MDEKTSSYRVLQPMCVGAKFHAAGSAAQLTDSVGRRAVGAGLVAGAPEVLGVHNNPAKGALPAPVPRQIG